MTKEKLKEVIKKRMENFNISFKLAIKEIAFIYSEYKELLKIIESEQQ